MSAVAGVRGTGNINASRRVVDISKRISVLEPDSAPLVQLVKKLEKRVAINPKFEWLEEGSLDKVDAVNYGTGYTAGATSVVVDTGSKFRAGDVVRNVTAGEQFLVSSISTNTLTIVRGWGSTAAQAFSDNDVLLIVGNANEEGATARTIKTELDVTKTNYLQIFRTPFGVTGTSENSELYGGKDLAHLRMTQLIEHQKEIERAFWWGEPKEDTSGTHPKRSTGGVDYFVSTNSTDGGTTLTEIEWESWLRTGFRYGSSVKFVFAAPIILSAVSYWAKGKLQLLPKDKTYGISIMQYLSPHGTVNLINAKLFGEVTAYAGRAFLLDLEGKAYRYLANRDTRLITNIQANDEDGERDEYKSEVGLHFEQEKKDSMLYNVTDFS